MLVRGAERRAAVRRALGEAMADLFERVGIPLEQRNGQLMAMGVTLKAEPLALPEPGRLGKMHRKVAVA